MNDQTKHLYRSSKNKTLAGVCGGIAEYFGIDPTIVRLIWIALTLLGGSGILLYIIAYFVMPKNPDFSAPAAPVSKSDFTAGKVIGVFLMFIGVLLLLNNLDFFSFHSFWLESWEFVLPALFVFAGIALLLKPRHPEPSMTEPTQSEPPKAEPEQPEPLMADRAASEEGTHEQANPSSTPEQRLLRRSFSNKKIFGICGGLGKYFDMDPTIVRLVYVVFTFLSAGTGFLLYILMYFIIPEETIPDAN
jgi:phage shock protein C